MSIVGVPLKRPTQYARAAINREQHVEQTIARACCRLGDFLDDLADREVVKVAYRELAALLDDERECLI